MRSTAHQAALAKQSPFIGHGQDFHTGKGTSIGRQAIMIQRRWRRRFMTQSPIKRDAEWRLPVKCVSTSAIIIIFNFFIGTFAPTTISLNDEIFMYDLLWRTASGQHTGTDFHDPMGFGPYQVGALLWHWFGPHNYIMRLSITFFSLAIALLACLVVRRLIRRADLALLFCVTLAFQLSTPTAYPDSAELGIMEFYDRLSASALAVLFLQTFGCSSIDGARNRLDTAFDIALIAFLLNALFLTKISGLLLGLMIVGAGCAIPGRFLRQSLILCAALVVFAAITAMQFELAGLSFRAVSQEYMVAARSRSVHSFYEIGRSLVNGPLIISMTLLVMFAVVRRRVPVTKTFSLRTFSLIVGSYIACQFALNMTNAGPPTMWLAPSAVVSLAICMNANAPAWPTNGSKNFWKNFDPRRLRDISVQEAIPNLIFVLVLFRQVLGSLFGIVIAVLTALGIVVPYAVTAGKGITFLEYPYRSGEHGAYVKTLINALSAIRSLKLENELIANLDFSNPFPVLLLATPPKGIHVWFAWGYNIPLDTDLHWHDVIGDACVVLLPAQPSKPSVTFRLVDSVRSKLMAEFNVVYRDEAWTIYQRNCKTALDTSPVNRLHGYDGVQLTSNDAFGVPHADADPRILYASEG
jgi:hypothetical protein